MEDQIRYHQDRAERELAIGLTAQSIPAARAHLQLASLHRDRAKALGGGWPMAKPSQVMA